MNDEIKVTEAMSEAGLDIFEQLVESYPNYLLVIEVYKAMEAARRMEDNQSRCG